MEAPNHILVLRGGAIGDFMLTLPVFAAMRRHWPRTHIACMAYPHLTALAAAAGLIDQALSLDALDAARLFAADTALSESWRKRMKRFEIALSYLHDPDDVVRRNLIRSGIARVIVHSPLVQAGHAVKHFLEPLSGMGLPLSGDPVPRLVLPGRLTEEARERWRFIGGDGAVLHPGSGSRSKNWPPQKFAALARRLSESDIPAAFLVGEAEAGLVDLLRSEAPAVPIVSEPDLVRLAALLSAAGVYVGNDSGITHLAAAVNVPVVALFGPTDDAVWGPIGRHVKIVRAGEPTTDSLAQMEVEKVLRLVRERLA